MRLTFYGGIKEIGGNKILLEDKKTVILLDFGKSYKEAGKYFEEFVNPRAVQGLKDYLELGLLPRKEGFYRQDLIKISGESGLTLYEKPKIDAVILSHGHLDHAGYISFLNLEIPVFTTKETLAVLGAFYISRPKNLENEIIEISEREEADFKKRKKKKRAIIAAEDQKPFFIKNLKITPIKVDHSVPGASMFLIESSIGSILYSGDFRLSEISEERKKEICSFLRKAKIKIFICEGTRIKEQIILREEKVRQDALEKIKEIKGLVVVDYSIGDVVRFKTLSAIARETKRFFALPYNYFNYLSFLKQNGINAEGFENVALYAKKKISFKKWEKDLIKNSKVVTSEDIAKDKKHYLLALNFYQIQELIDLKINEDCFYLRAITEPHSEEMEISEERFVNWIKHFKMQGLREEIIESGEKKSVFDRAHISGHISGKELAEFIEKIKPEAIIPIHTEFPEEFKNIYKNIIIAEKNETIKI
ncbi:MAG: MBL fold metallo-hydrolase [Candidatus Paceibacterota bacterium]|nr:MBL fold metallo-hydrolase [Candidatus Paceibacterota bacterium]MDD4998987.1 MBL fold metallo-hydrolase [Candidatus Paceibacterota bacterium]